MKKSNQQRNPNDGYLRVTKDDLLSLNLLHLGSEHLPGITEDFLQFGLTEWCAQHNQGIISLSWDWALDRDYELQAHFEHDPRFNIMLLNEAGDDLGTAATTEFIKTMIGKANWRKTVLEDMLPSNRHKVHAANIMSLSGPYPC